MFESGWDYELWLPSLLCNYCTSYGPPDAVFTKCSVLILTPAQLVSGRRDWAPLLGAASGLVLQYQAQLGVWRDSMCN